MTEMEQSAHPFPGRTRTRMLERAGELPVLLFLAFAIFSFALQAFRIDVAPDLLGDEASYAHVAKNIASGVGLVQFGGGVFLWHPPLYMYLEAAWLYLFGLVDADPVTIIYRLRLINAIASGITAGLLFLIGNRLQGIRTGFCIALLFCLDPYVQRINRRNMLETMAALFVVLGVYLYQRQLHTRRRRALDALPVGLAFGLALLTKEVMIFALAIPFLVALFYRREQLRWAIMVAIVALAVYAMYPMMLTLGGYGSDYFSMKSSQALRLLGGLVGSGSRVEKRLNITAGNVTFLESMAVLLPNYFFTYITLLAAVGIAVWRFLRHKVREEGLLIMWAASAYGFIGFGMIFGRISDQFFYYTVIPAVVLVGYGVSLLIGGAQSRGQAWRSQALAGSGARGVPVARIAALALVVVGLGWNLGVFTRLFVYGRDNSVAMLYNHINRSIAPGETIVFGSDIANYILPNYRIEFHRDPEAARRDDVRYFVLNSKERWGGYSRVTPEFYDWVTANSRVLFHQYGNTYWDLNLFEITPGEATR